jgi:hypothetical protein
MVDSHIPRLFTAVLTRMVVAGENLVARHLSTLKWAAHHVNQPDDVWTIEYIVDGVYVKPGVLYRFGLAFTHEFYRPANIADVKRLVVLVKHQYWCPRAFARLGARQVGFSGSVVASLPQLADFIGYL